MKKFLLALSLMLPVTLGAQIRGVSVADDTSGRLRAPTNFFWTNFIVDGVTLIPTNTSGLNWGTIIRAGSWGNTLFLDATNGVDATAERGQSGKPWRTASNAVANLVSGDTLYVKNGVYPIAMGASYWTTNGPLKIWAKSNITVYGELGATFQLQGLGTMFSLGQVTNITMSGLTLIGVKTNNQSAQQSSAIWVQGGAKQLRFNNLKIWHHQNHGIGSFMNNTDEQANWVVDGCDFYNNGFTNFASGLPDDGVCVGVVGNQMRIVNNTFRFNLRAIETYEVPSVAAQFLRDYVIADNTFEGQIQFDIQMFHTNLNNFVICNNTHKMYSTNRSAISGAQVCYSIQSAINMIIANNTIDGADYGFNMDEDTPGYIDGLLFKNNTMKNINNVGMAFQRNIGSGPPHKRVVIDNNLFYNIGSQAIFDAVLQDSAITDNQFISTGSGGAGVAIGIGNFGNPTNMTNILISGNIIANAAGTADTDETIVVGNQAWGVRSYDNMILAGTAPTYSSSNRLARGREMKFVSQIVHGTGGALTNYTLTSDLGYRYINGFTGVNFNAIMGGKLGQPELLTVVITNGGAFTNDLGFSAVTNRWKWYNGITPTRLSNNWQIILDLKIDGTNVFGRYDYFTWP